MKSCSHYIKWGCGVFAWFLPPGCLVRLKFCSLVWPKIQNFILFFFQFWTITFFSGAGTGGARGGTAPPPIFGGSVNPFEIGEGRLSPPITTGPLNFFHLPASLISSLTVFKVTSSNTSLLEPHAGFFRLLMKGIFDRYVLWHFDKKVIS